MLLPICDVCGKPVERIECVEDMGRGEKHYWVYCHGAAEEVRLSRQDMIEAKKISSGRAFKKTRTDKKLSVSNFGTCYLDVVW